MNALSNRISWHVLGVYAASLLAAMAEDAALSQGASWSNVAPAAFAVIYAALLFISKRPMLFVLLTLPAFVLAERQLFLVVFMVLPYLFSSSL